MLQPPVNPGFCTQSIAPNAPDSGHRALLTSRIGLGEIERRYPLVALNQREAVVLFKNLARDKGLQDLGRMPDTVINSYVEKLHRYPLAIKWTVGQVSLGKDLNSVIAGTELAGGHCPPEAGL